MFNEKLAQRIRAGLSTHATVEKRMFGGLCFMVDGVMCCGVHKNDFVARVGGDRHEEAMQQAYARLMDFTGRPMRGFLFVGAAGVRTDAQLNKWLAWCAAHAASDEAQKRSKRHKLQGRRTAPKTSAKRPKP